MCKARVIAVRDFNYIHIHRHLFYLKRKHLINTMIFFFLILEGKENKKGKTLGFILATEEEPAGSKALEEGCLHHTEKTGHS